MLPKEQQIRFKNFKTHSCYRALKINSDATGCVLGLLWETLAICSALRSDHGL